MYTEDYRGNQYKYSRYSILSRFPSLNSSKSESMIDATENEIESPDLYNVKF